MRAFRQRRVVRLTVLFAALCWVAGQLGVQIHALRVLHVRCAEHGITIEVDTSGAQAHRTVRAPDISAPDLGEHDHDCPMMAVCDDLTASDDVQPDAPFSGALVVGVRASPGAPRGPPLSYAPKTSPPAHS